MRSLRSLGATHLVAFGLSTGLAFTAPAYASPYGAPPAKVAPAPKNKLVRNIKLGAAAVALAIPLTMGVSSYNGLATQHEQVKASWSNVDVELQRRADLIPNLVSVVKGYAAHEQQTFVKVAEARAAFQGANGQAARMAAGTQLAVAMQPLMVMQERYPELKANENFQSLMRSLEQTENRISISRNRYNDAATAYNTSIKLFPKNMVAKMGSFESAPYYKSENVTVNVSFDH